MGGGIILLLLLIAYTIFAYLVIKRMADWTSRANRYLRLIVLSLLISLLFGIGIVATGGDPGFAFPAPNILAIAIMLNTGVYHGAITGFYVVAFWWIVVFCVLLIANRLKRKNPAPQP